MKKIIISIFILCMVFTSNIYAFEPLTKTDIALEVTWETLHFIDWGQTLNIADRPDKFYEINPILGKHPSRADVNLYMVSTTILHPLITYALPKEIIVLDTKIPVRTMFQSISIMVSGGLVINNFSIGLNCTF